MSQEAASETVAFREAGQRAHITGFGGQQIQVLVMALLPASLVRTFSKITMVSIKAASICRDTYCGSGNVLSTFQIGRHQIL